MSWWALTFAMAGAVGVVRAGVSLRSAPERTLAGGLVVAVAFLTVVAWLSEPVLSGLEVSQPNARVAAGMVLALTGAVDLVRPALRELEVPRRGWAALVPVAWPVVLRPAAALLALSGGADRGGATVLVAAAIACGVIAVVASWPPRRIVEGGLHALVSALTVAFALEILVEGVLDV